MIRRLSTGGAATTQAHARWKDRAPELRRARLTDTGRDGAAMDRWERSLGAALRALHERRGRLLGARESFDVEQQEG